VQFVFVLFCLKDDIHGHHMETERDCDHALALHVTEGGEDPDGVFFNLSSENCSSFPTFQGNPKY
jgi:hypothetical protein